MSGGCSLPESTSKGASSRSGPWANADPTMAAISAGIYDCVLNVDSICDPKRLTPVTN